jgi:hypothetical protein
MILLYYPTINQQKKLFRMWVWVWMWVQVSFLLSHTHHFCLKWNNFPFDFSSRPLLPMSRNRWKKTYHRERKGFQNFGCHFCLFVSARSQANTAPRQFQVLNDTDIDVKTFDLVGYIQMDNEQYYRLLPVEHHRQTWFDAFKRRDYIVIT